MKISYIHFRKYIAYALLLGLCLQSCGGSNEQIIHILKGQKEIDTSDLILQEEDILKIKDFSYSSLLTREVRPSESAGSIKIQRQANILDKESEYVALDITGKIVDVSLQCLSVRSIDVVCQKENLKEVQTEEDSLQGLNYTTDQEYIERENVVQDEIKIGEPEQGNPGQTRPTILELSPLTQLSHPIVDLTTTESPLQAPHTTISAEQIEQGEAVCETQPIRPVTTESILMEQAQEEMLEQAYGETGNTFQNMVFQVEHMEHCSDTAQELIETEEAVDTEREHSSLQAEVIIVNNAEPDTSQKFSSSKKKRKKHKHRSKKAKHKNTTDKQANQSLNNLADSSNRNGSERGVTPEFLDELKAKVLKLEEAGDNLAAAKKMNDLLKLIPSPTIEDLCHGLHLNSNLSHIDEYTNEANRISMLISKYLQVDPNDLEIEIKHYTWKQLWPYLDYMIAKAVENSAAYELWQVKYTVMGEDMGQYTDWLLARMRHYKYPISISGGNYATEGDKSAEGVWDIYKQELKIENYAHKELQAREQFAYKFFGGKIDTSQIDPGSFYNLMVRAGFTPEHFEEGKHGFQDKIFVKPILLREHNIKKCLIDLRNHIISTLEKAEQPYVTFVFRLEKKTPFCVSKLYSHDNGSLSRYFCEKLSIPRATIIEPREKQIYLCFVNDRRKRLDLHHTSVEEAFEKVHEFITRKYHKFEKNCTVITGRGNHVNTNGQKGVLHKKFKEWAQNELNLYIESIKPIAQDGGYEVVLKKPTTVVLKGKDSSAQIEQIATGILKAYQIADKRLVITHQKKQEKSYFDTLVLQALRELHSKHAYCISTSLEDMENGVRLTWGKSKS
jgi:hypothetical protein